MILTCDATGLTLPLLTADTVKAAEQLRSLIERHLPIDAPPSRRRELARLLGLIADSPSVAVPECGLRLGSDDVELLWLGRQNFTWVCPRCGTEHESYVQPGVANPENLS